jgi:maleylpyruvate isomerase
MITLHGYWRSTASYRLRIALGLKGIAFRQVTHDLRIGAQMAEDYLAISPQGLVPALQPDDKSGNVSLIQSMAIMEWLEEQWPEPSLLPADPIGRAVVRAMAQIIACDIHPLNNLRVLARLRRELRADETQVSHWITHWISSGFSSLESLILRHGGQFAFGDSPTFADCCLVPQLFAAERFQVDTEAFPALVAVAGHARSLDVFRMAEPERQADATR